MVGTPNLMKVEAAFTRLAKAASLVTEPGTGSEEYAQAIMESVEIPELGFVAYMGHLLNSYRRLGVAKSDGVLALAGTLVLLRRVEATGAIALSPYTLHRLGLTCFSIAKKALIDGPRISNSVCAAVAGVSPEEHTDLELALLGVLNWDVMITQLEIDEIVFSEPHVAPAPLPIRRPKPGLLKSFFRVVLRK